MTQVLLLHVEDDKPFARALARHCDGRAQLRRVASAAEMRGAAHTANLYDGVVLDLHLPDASGKATLNLALELFPGVPLFVLADTLEDVPENERQRVRHGDKLDLTPFDRWLNAVVSTKRMLMAAAPSTPERGVPIAGLDYEQSAPGTSPGAVPATPPVVPPPPPPSWEARFGKWVLTALSTAVVAGVVATIGFYTDVHNERTRAGQIHEQIERDLARAERQRHATSESLRALREDFSGLKSAVEAQNQNHTERYEAIQEALDRSSNRRGRR